MINQWRSRDGELFVLSILAGILVGGLLLLMRLNFFLALIGFIGTFLYVYDSTRLHHKAVVKIFAASMIDAQQVVQNVLQEKGLPFSSVGPNQYVIEDEVSIKLENFRQHGFQGTAVSLTPKHHDCSQLIFNLRSKLDEAFRPRGL
ncbi:MAG: hypothetical protein H6657_26900 [Ardenticatenaceae bacterium]|nr:hypothetical protein [Ardenticatenaceae bacterium]